MEHCTQCGRILWRESTHVIRVHVRASEKLKWGIFSVAMVFFSIVFLFVAKYSWIEWVSLLCFVMKISCLTGFAVGVMKLLMVTHWKSS